MQSDNDSCTDEDHEDLDAYELSATQKRGMGRDIVSGHLTTRKVHHRHNLKRRTVQKYAHVVRVGGILYDKGGRPCQIDEIGFLRLGKYWFDNPGLSNDSVKVIIDLERERTHNRRLGVDEAVEVCLPSLHRSTYCRYMNYMRPIVQDFEISRLLLPSSQTSQPPTG
jgi:hypothetical protein